jgi:hypothetical protein
LCVLKCFAFNHLCNAIALILCHVCVAHFN